jgi:pyruvate dehydrogenase E1 component alpha subunit
MSSSADLRVEPENAENQVATTKEELLSLFRQMLAVRRLEEACAKAYSVGKIGGFLHLIIGQEAVCVGALSAMEPDDYAIGSYRTHGHAYTRGTSSRAILAELWGKKTGIVKGLGGSMHIFDKDKNFLGGHGIVGGQVPLGVGAAFKAKYKGEKRVSVVFFGEGSTTIGGFTEALALAALWKLPVVFICENNQYSMGTPVHRTMAVPDVSKRALAHDMERDRFDGDDVVRVKRRVAHAIKRAREESLPTLIEIRTYRFRGHSMSDPGLYRTREEVAEWKKGDPINKAKQRLLEELETSAEEISAIEAEVKEEIADAVRFADSSPPADEYLSYVIKE